MTPEELSEFMRAIGSFTHDRIQLAVEPLKKQIKNLSDRVEDLEASGIKYCGVWQRANEYKRGDVATHEGSMFVAVANPRLGEMPGQSLNWQLAVKRGRDGKDRAA